jgi:hypothetical protein
MIELSMKIEHYSFGKIIIDGNTYTSDVIIYPDRIDSSWWRQEGHHLRSTDLIDAISVKPDIIVLGTGYSGMMVVPDETVTLIKSEGIDVQVERTGRAVELFNTLEGTKRAIAALHITC